MKKKSENFSVFVCYCKATTITPTTTTTTNSTAATTNIPTSATTLATSNSNMNNTTSTTTTTATGEGEWKLERTREFYLPLYTQADERIGLSYRIYRLLSIITGILIVQRDAVLSYEHIMYTTLEYNKRARTTIVRVYRVGRNVYRVYIDYCILVCICSS